MRKTLKLLLLLLPATFALGQVDSIVIPEPETLDLQFLIAEALINNPEIIFADEPSGNLDSANAKELHQLFFRLRDEFKQSFVIVTHNEELANMADRKLVMQDGKILG